MFSQLSLAILWGYWLREQSCYATKQNLFQATIGIQGWPRPKWMDRQTWRVNFHSCLFFQKQFFWGFQAKSLGRTGLFFTSIALHSIALDVRADKKMLLSRWQLRWVSLVSLSFVVHYSG